MAINEEFVERCQLEYQKNPRSKVFAPLAEAYRKMGLLDEAFRICKLGVQFNPDFAGGFVAYAKVLIDRKAPAEALAQLERAVRLSPDNLLAHSLMGEVLIELRRPKDALNAFKMVLFLNPDDDKARQSVKKWEFLTADEYADDVFEMRPIFDQKIENPAPADDPNDVLSVLEASIASHPIPARAMERAISLADAFTVRNDLESAFAVLAEARRVLGPVDDIERRYKLVARRLGIAEEELAEKKHVAKPQIPETPEPTKSAILKERVRAHQAATRTDQGRKDQLSPKNDKREKLEALLRRINTRRGVEG